MADDIDRIWQKVSQMDKESAVAYHKIDDSKSEIDNLTRRHEKVVRRCDELEDEVGKLVEGKNNKFEANQAVKNRRHEIQVTLIGAGSATVSAIVVYFATL